MKSYTTSDFWKTYAKLSNEAKEQSQKAYQLWKDNPFHPSLHFKKVGKNLWSARINLDIRALALKKDEDYYWIWIGTHDQYNAILS